MTKVAYSAGRNMAMKIPPRLFEETVAFYRDVLALPLVDHQDGSPVFQFGAMRLWLDRAPTMSQTEIWLEIRADDVEAAARDLRGHGIARCDEIEPLADGFEGFWISAPGGIIHLVTGKSDPEESLERR